MQKGPAIGFYMDRPIFDWIEDDSGRRWEFIGICGPIVDLESLESDLCVIAPGLLYRRQSSTSTNARHAYSSTRNT
ncbi:MAG: hypothetical protein ACK4SA_16680 [Caldilinea sp.]